MKGKGDFCVEKHKVLNNMKLIVGLGNPGIKYEKNRHNIGFSVISALLKDLDAPEMSSKFNSKFIGVKMNGEKTILLMPETYMNNSGKAVREVVDYYKIKPHNILVIVDDKDLKLGKIRIKSKGSSGGQNGVKSIIQHLGHENFNRMKIGVGNPKPGQDTADYVLSDFSKEDKSVIAGKMSKYVSACKDFMKGDILELKNKWNNK